MNELCAACGKNVDALVRLSVPGKEPTPAVCEACMRRAIDTVKGSADMDTTEELLKDLDSTTADIHGRCKQAAKLCDDGRWDGADAVLDVAKQRLKLAIALVDAIRKDIKECLVDEKGTARTPAERTRPLPFPDGKKGKG